MIRLCAEKFDPSQLLKAFTGKASGAGAIASFTGLVRQEGDRNVSALVLHHHPRLTQPAIEQAAHQAITRWKLIDVCIAHRIGHIETGEPVVFVATAAPHRSDAFESCDMLMDFMKTDAPFWKQEIAHSGDKWIEPKQTDYIKRSRWD